MNSGHTYLFLKGFCTVYFVAREKNAASLPHSAQTKHTFFGEIKEMLKTKKLPSRKKIALELLYHRLDHRSTIALLVGYTANVWEDIDLRIYADPISQHVKISQWTKRLGLKIH